MELKDKVALVTGGSRGIGRQIVLDLAKEGVKVAINYNSSQDKAEQVKKEVVEIGSSAIILKADVSNFVEVKEMVEEVYSNFSKIDILINNAGINIEKPFQEITEEDWNKVINVNLKGTYNCAKLVIDKMISQRKGKIVNLSSVAGIIGCDSAHYCAAKAGVIGFTISLARELAKYDITVNAVAPAIIDTDWHISWLNERAKEELTSRKLVRLGRAGKPEEISSAVMFLLKNDYVTGTVVDVWGGFWGD